MTELNYTDQAGSFDKYNVDLCLVIDKTGSMSPIIDTVKKNALNMYPDIVNALKEKKKNVGKFRIRVIWFGDYVADKEPMFLSDFMEMPEKMENYRAYVNGIKPNGGGDAPEDGLEALAYAIRSDWIKEGWKRRHIIAVFTDAPPHNLGYGRHQPSYPKTGMPEDFGELTEMWENEMDYRAKRLLLFTPQKSWWEKAELNWEGTILQSVKEGEGLQQVTYEVVLNSIVNSV